MKGKSPFIKRRDSSDPWTMNQTANIKTSVPSVYSFGNSKCVENYEERSVIAQPVFVFKKEQPYKRPAEDPVCKTENVSVECSRKRARSSSFSFQSCDLHLHKVNKNNIFMTSTLLEKIVDVKAIEKDIPPSNGQWDVLKPATLQPPQAPMGRLEENTDASDVLEAKHKADTEASEDTYSLTDNPKKPPFSFHTSGYKITRNQLLHGCVMPSSKHSDFVFGENIVERVLRPETFPEVVSEGNSENKSRCTIDFYTSSPWKVPTFAKETTLVESAIAYTSSKPTQKCLLEKVNIATGEEDEYKVLQINCKLFLFNKVSLTWIERGYGVLRLNDTSSNRYGMLQSRLVMRNQGSMRLIFNTKLWTQMIIKRANRKSLCITATDLEDSSVKVFLIQASSKDVGSLYAAIHHRLVTLRNSAKQECEANQVEPELEILPINHDSDEEDNEEITPVSKSEINHSQWTRRQPVYVHENSLPLMKETKIETYLVKKKLKSLYYGH